MSEVIEVQDSTPRFTIKSVKNPAKKAELAEKARMRRHYRRSETIFNKVAELHTQTGWTGFVLLQSPDGKHCIYGGADQITDRFQKHQPLTEVPPTSENSSKVSMTKVMEKVVKAGKGKKLTNLVLDTPEKDAATPTSGLLSADSQKESLEAIEFSVDVAAPFADIQNHSILRQVETSRSNVRRKLSTIYDQKRQPATTGKKRKRVNKQVMT